MAMELLFHTDCFFLFQFALEGLTATMAMELLFHTDCSFLF
jgi:hypothetical protein